MVIFHSYVSLPEGIHYCITKSRLKPARSTRPGPRRPTLTARALNGLHRVQGQDHQHGSHGALQGVHGDPEMPGTTCAKVWDVI